MNALPLLVQVDQISELSRFPQRTPASKPTSCLPLPYHILPQFFSFFFSKLPDMQAATSEQHSSRSGSLSADSVSKTLHIQAAKVVAAHAGSVGDTLLGVPLLCSAGQARLCGHCCHPCVHASILNICFSPLILISVNCLIFILFRLLINFFTLESLMQRLLPCNGIRARKESVFALHYSCKASLPALTCNYQPDSVTS